MPCSDYAVLLKAAARLSRAHYKKDDLLSCWASSLDISGYHMDFHKGHSNARAGQGHGMLCVNRP